MGFRGALLQLSEAQSGAGFRLLAPDAELALPPRPVTQEPALAKWSRQKLVVSDAVSKKPLQVARLAAVALQRAERSVLWGVTAPFAPPESRSVGAPPLASYRDVPGSVKSTHAPANGSANADDASSLAAAVASTSMVAMPLGVQVPDKQAQPTRLCFCFHFRSQFEFDLFARTIDAFTRMQRYALVQSSVVMEMEINLEQKKRRQERERLQNAPDKGKAVKKLLSAKKKSEPKVTTPAPKPKKPVMTPPAKMVCVLCRMQRKPDSPEYPKHPFVLKDGKGEEIHICKVCLQRVLQQRMKIKGENFCGLCAQATEKMASKTVKACSHEMCTRIYCMACIEKLFGKAQAHKVWRTKNWLCPNCSTDNEASEQAGDGDTATAASVASKPANAKAVPSVDPVTKAAPSSAAPSTTTRPQKKRKRRNEIEESTADEDTATEAEPVPVSGDMKPLDYAVTYFQFLLGREERGKWEESEDVCFCCKDGGDVLECDWKGMNGAFERCPKVYHEDCLGYVVPEGKKWVCPRHRCQDCGVIALFSCRFCVTSYCEEHLPRGIKKIGMATQDIPTSTYVVCPRCSHQARDALREKKLTKDIHAKLYRRDAHNGNQ